MLLSREVLDRQLIDRRGNRMGRVDGVVLECRPGELPRLAYLESGGYAPWQRLGKHIERAVRAVQRWLPGTDEPARIPWAAVLKVDVNIDLSIDATETPTMALELWLREHVVRHLP